MIETNTKPLQTPVSPYHSKIFKNSLLYDLFSIYDQFIYAKETPKLQSRKSYTCCLYSSIHDSSLCVTRKKKKKKAEDLGDSSSTPAAPQIKRQLKQFQANIPMYDVMERGKWQ